jgi:glycosyltransferase involved in cell wall biosynthesis
MAAQHRFLMNFAASYSGGGYKRLYEFARWFNLQGGTNFAIHPHCAPLIQEFPQNRFFVVRQTRLRRLIDDRSYLDSILANIGFPDLYFSFGIPLYRPIAQVNWAHVNNIFTVGAHHAPISVSHRLKYAYLGRRVRGGFRNSQIISAESKFSVDLLANEGFGNLFLSKNGADDEIAYLGHQVATPVDNIATVVGTHDHKGLSDSLQAFIALKRDNPTLTMVVIGDYRQAPASLRSRDDVQLTGLLPRACVIERLRRSRYFISTSYVENSCNGASEGIFHAEQSVLSDIPPHRELLAGEFFQQITFPGSTRQFLRVNRHQLLGLNLQDWNTVITEMVSKADEMLRSSPYFIRAKI